MKSLLILIVLGVVMYVAFRFYVPVSEQERLRSLFEGWKGRQATTTPYVDQSIRRSEIGHALKLELRELESRAAGRSRAPYATSTAELLQSSEAMVDDLEHVIELPQEKGIGGRILDLVLPTERRTPLVCPMTTVK